MDDSLRVRRLATTLAVLAAVTLVAAGAAVWMWLEADRLAGDTGNRALADAEATRVVTEQVTAGVKAVFSYDHANLARTERAARDVLVDGAVEQYRRGFAAARAQAEQERLVRTTTVRAAGVRTLSGDQARLLVFLDQQTLRPDGSPPQSAPAHLDVGARKVDGVWKIADLVAL
ncbi:hypothetical protein EWH70_16305 [Amycolatopsis suaedae]|uniref:Mce-associated membrane protein n=2 Tax=Amycolatopsis suaedae TaxID=2510978 RepID=A0A4Q7J8I4_9PSEU|nr:hypothetical protein EWH70_16305 [Amycolatopsis suaedae]